MLDFNPSAVVRGIGNVVREPTTLPASESGFMEDVTTYLPYVDVVSNDCYLSPCTNNIIIDEERILTSNVSETDMVSVFPPVELIKLTISLNRIGGRRCWKSIYLACSPYPPDHVFSADLCTLPRGHPYYIAYLMYDSECKTTYLRV